MEAVFALLIEHVGGHVATSYNDVGGYRLDYNSVYGGFNIERITSETGAVTIPFGSRRYGPSEMWNVLKFAIDMLREEKSK